MLVQFEHKKTNLPGLFITDKPFFVGSTYSFKIEKAEDIPDFEWAENFNMPSEIEKKLGKKGMDSYFKSFIDYPDIYYLEFLENGFPNNKIPL